MVCGFLREEEEAAASGGCELVKLVGHVSVVAEHNGAGAELGADAGVFAFFVFGRVVGVVDEEVDWTFKTLEAFNGIAVEDLAGFAVGTLEQPAGLGIDIGSEIATRVPFGTIAQQSSSKHATAQTLVHAGFHDGAGLEGTHQRIPAQPTAVAHVEIGGDGAV